MTVMFLTLAKLPCDALRHLVSFMQFKKREKHPWRNVTFSSGPIYCRFVESEKSQRIKGSKIPVTVCNL